MLFQQRFYVQINIRVNLISIIVKGAAMCYQLFYIFTIFTQFVKKKKCTISVMTWLACNIGFWWYFIKFPLKVRKDFFTDIRSNKSCQVYTEILILCKENICGQYWDYWKLRSWSVTWNLTLAGTEQLMLFSFPIHLLCR